MNDYVEVNRTDLVAIFTTWNEEAEKGNWKGSSDLKTRAEGQADTFLEFAQARIENTSAEDREKPVNG